MAKSELFPALTDITFADKDPDAITSEILSQYEALTGRTLARADPVRLFLDTVILAIIQQRTLIDFAAKQNLLAYAQGEYLDHIGALLGVSRLPAGHAAATLRFTLSAAYAYNVVIPSGTRVSTGDGITFATTAETVILAGCQSVSVPAQCVTAGTIGNGYAPGQVNRLVDVLSFGVSAENITETSGGTDTESDENYRERIQIAPESFSVAGPKEAYKYFARSANSDIIDVAVIGPPVTQPGYVDIYPLMTGGMLPGSLYTVSDGINSEVVQAQSINLENGIQRVILKDRIANTYILENTQMFRTSSKIDSDHAIGPNARLKVSWTPSLVWQGMGDSQSFTVSADTSLSSTSAYSVSGDIAFGSGGLVSLSV